MPDYDFYLNVLGFNTKITKDSPFERATAQFRKEQLDSGATVGDQSLTGWWTRGQLSFHKGAGVRYYEVLGDSDKTIESRFRTSLAVDPWTPGEVTLARAFDQIDAGGILDVVPYAPGGAYDLNPSNLVANSTFATNTTGWESNTGFGFYDTAAFVRSTVRSHSDTASLLATWPTGTRSWVNTSITTVPGKTYEITAWVYVPTGSPDVEVHAAFISGANAVSASGTSIKDAWTQISGTFTAIAATSYVGVLANTPTSAQTCYIDDFQVTEVPPADTGVAALLGSGAIVTADGSLGAQVNSYTDQGILSITSNGSLVWACTASAIEGLVPVTRYQYVTNPAFSGSGDTTFATLQGGAASQSFTGSAITWTTTTAATDGIRFVVPITTATSRRNLVPNPSFETSTAGWLGDTQQAISRAGGGYGSSTYALKMVTSSASARTAATTSGTGGIPVTASTAYTASFYVKRASISRTATAAIRWYNSGGSLIGTSSGTPVAVNGMGSWLRASVTATSPVGAAYAAVAMTFGAGTSGDTLYADSVLLEQASTVGTYFDGSTSTLAGYTCSWTEDPGMSASVAVASSAGPAQVLVRVKVNKDSDIQAWDGAAYTSIGAATATVTKSFVLDVASDHTAKFQVMAKAGSTGATSLSVLSVTSSVAESATPNPADARWSWLGTTNSSVQSRTVGDGALSVLWAPPTGSTWGGAWYVKDRLLAVDNTGRWYSLAPTGGGAVDAADTFWASGMSSGWTVTESPASIYLGRDRSIYALTLDTDGLIPTIESAVIAGQIPVGENISSMVNYLGYLIICTNHGVRAALVQSDASITLGSLFIKGDFSGCNRIGADGDLVYVTGVEDDDADSAVYAVNVVNLVDTLIPGYARLSDVVDDPCGTSLGGNGRLYVYDSIGLHRESDELVAAGSLTTGFHRFGTLEPKSFRFLRIKTEGADGHVDVSVNTPDGTTYAVGTVGAGRTEEFDLSTVSDFPDSLEYLSITFTLNREAGGGPTLLGYQLKAMPVPKRQRMIRVPLMLFDSEQNRQGQTIAGDPWTRLAALEALEESNAVVTFDDKETGETGSAYIESVEVTRTAPAQGGKRGFGGTIFVTLRRL